MLLTVERAQAFYKRSQPLPPMETQLVGLEQRIMKRFDEQDKEWAKKLEDLREHIDTETVRLHERIDAHGKELYRLQGYVYGRHAHGVPPEERT